MTNIIKEAIEELKKNKAVIFPTDTVYGIGVLPNKIAIDNLYKLKKRDKSKKIIALVSDIKHIEKIAKNIDYKIIKKFMPGPISIIFETNDCYKKILGDTIGVRIPNNKLALELLNLSNGILMTSSANISGNNPIINIKDLDEELKQSVNVILTTDENLSGTPSTIISCIKGKYTLIREGEIKFEEILKMEENIENNKCCQNK